MTTAEIIKSLVHDRLERRHETVCEQFWFRDKEHVSATLGLKEGAVCGTGFKYRITECGDIEMYESGQTDGESLEEVRIKWMNPSLDGNVLSVLMNGEKCVYDVIRRPKKKSLWEKVCQQINGASSF